MTDTASPGEADRLAPYKNFKFIVSWDGKPVAGISKVGDLTRTTQVVSHREGGDPSLTRKSPGQTDYGPITLERGITHDPEAVSCRLRPQMLRKEVHNPVVAVHLVDILQHVVPLVGVDHVVHLLALGLHALDHIARLALDDPRIVRALHD